MTLSPHFAPLDLSTLATRPGRIVVFAEPGAPLPAATAKLDRAMRGAIARATQSEAFGKLALGDGLTLGYPSGLVAEAVQIIRLPRKPDVKAQRKAGLTIAKGLTEAETLVALDTLPAPVLVQAIALRAYRYDAQKSAPKPPFGPLTIAAKDPDKARLGCADGLALARAVHLTRDLTTAPANVLTTTSFAAQIEGLASLGLKIEVLDEDELARLGLRAMLAVGQGSESPSKLAILHWQGAEGAPLCVVGKGVMFDTGGISIKPAAGMEEMTMDMGGAAVTVGLMAALAERGATANVVGLVGLVENMPDGRAQRPGDVVKSLKGDMIEVINTDAEGRLVLADMLWYAQERFNPSAIIDLATLTGAIIIALGHERAGVFGNDDALTADFLRVADNMGEGAWRMPLGQSYHDQIKARVGDIKNTGGRPAGACTAAAFLESFIKPGTPWLHLDIAGVALTSAESAHAPKGASGWGVLSLDALIRARFERG
ncbi:MAG: leucyl aminopeptidase [Roseinatronobacter sp.]